VSASSPLTAAPRPSAVTHLGPDGAVPHELKATLSFAAGVVGGANIVMQLAALPVGHGVAESRVDRGRLDLHPVKRARTTFGYVMIALFGTDEERERLGAAVTAVHRQVRSRPGDPVRYSALDPELQLWVAACIYRGVEDAHTMLYGPPSPELLDVLYPHAARIATMLQVPAAAWPPDRDAFEAYWQEQVAGIAMDEVTRTYLYDFAGLGFLPQPVPALLGRYHRAVTAGFLPAPFRQELGLAWGPAEQRAFRWTCGALRTLNAMTPRPLRRLPLMPYLWDMRRRLRHGRNVL
jgi:uncharacterized protein (DUF2236 family)